MILILLLMRVGHNDKITIRRHQVIEQRTWKRSPSKLDAEDDQNLSVLDELAVITVWHNDINNQFEESIDEVDDKTEDIAEETTI